MSIKKLKKIHPAIWISLAIIVVGLLSLRLAYFAYDWALAESRDYALMDELISIGGYAEAYKRLNDFYPKSLADINKSDMFCDYTFNIKKCTHIYYKPSTDLQDFKIAADAGPVSGSWPVLFYSTQFSASRDVINNLGSEEYKLKNKNSNICWFCAAYRSINARGSDIGRPVYKQDPKYFPNPDEWPDLQ